jgi:hypothetical protein
MSHGTRQSFHPLTPGESLALACDAVLPCTKPTTHGRITTADLLSKRSADIHLNVATKFHHFVKPEGDVALCDVGFLNMLIINM